jgi:hypothetical protein
MDILSNVIATVSGAPAPSVGPGNVVKVDPISGLVCYAMLC